MFENLYSEKQIKKQSEYINNFLKETEGIKSFEYKRRKLTYRIAIGTVNNEILEIDIPLGTFGGFAGCCDQINDCLYDKYKRMIINRKLLSKEGSKVFVEQHTVPITDVIII